MRVQSRGLYDEEDDDVEALGGIGRQEPFSLQQENQISTEITPQEIPDIRRLGALSAIQGVPGVSNAESAEIEASPSAPPAEPMMQENAILPPDEESAEPGFFSRLGSALSNVMTPPPYDIGQQEQPVSTSPFPDNIQYVSERDPSMYMHAGIRGQFEQNPETDFYRNSPAALQYAPPRIKEEIGRENQLRVENFEKKHAEMKATGNPDIIDGEIEALEADPSAQAQFEEITGIDYTNELGEQLKDYVNAASGATEALNAESQAIRERIAGGAQSMTNTDKIMLGLSVLIPVILAGAFGGKEGALGALSGGLQGLGMALGKEKDLDSGAAMKRLSEIEKDKLAVEKQVSEQSEKSEKNLKKQTEIKGSNIKLIPELEGFEAKTYKDAKGEEKTGVRIGDDEFLYNVKNLRKGNATADMKRMNEAAEEAIVKKQNLEAYEATVKQMDNIYEQLEKQGVKGYFDAALGELVSGGQNILSATVIDPVTGEKVNAAATLKSLRETGLDNYRKALGGNRALTGMIGTHFQGILPNPFDFYNKLSVSEARGLGKTQIGNARNKFVEGLVAEGFLREPLDAKYLRPIKENKIAGQKQDKQNRQVSQSTKFIRENPGLRNGEVVEVDTNG